MKGSNPSKGSNRITAMNVINVPTAQSRPKSLIIFDSATVSEANPVAVVSADNMQGRPNFCIEADIASLRLEPIISSRRN